jgi:thioredoxin 1
MNTTVIIVLASFAAFILYLVYNFRKMKNMPAVEENEKIKHLNDKNFNQITGNGVSLIDFWAAWCMPCKMMAPVLNDVADEQIDNVNICKVDVESEQKLAAKFGVRSIPTLVLMKNGKEIDRFVGVKSKDFLVNQINKVK